MATEKDSKGKRRILKSETLREKAAKASEVRKPRRLSVAKDKVSTPLKFAARFRKKEFHPIKLPDNKLGRFMTKPRRATPNYFRLSWIELRQVVWPNRKETTKLTIAVFAFAAFFMLIISVVDYGLDKIFKALIL